MVAAVVAAYPDELLIDECRQAFAWLKTRVSELNGTEEVGGDFILGRFGGTINRLDSLELVTLDDRAFEFDNGVMRINRGAILRLLRFVIDDTVHATSDGPILDRKVIMSVVKQTFLLFFFHEIDHLNQGVGRYEDVSALKKLAGPGIMADLDLIADRDAALAVGCLMPEYEVSDRRSELQAYQNMIYMMGQYCLPVFGVSRSNLPKMGRAMGLTFMAARLAAADWSGGWDKDDSNLQLDTCLMCNPDAGYTGFTLRILEPSPRVLTVEADLPTCDLSVMADHLERGRFLEAVAAGCSILRALGMGPR